MFGSRRFQELSVQGRTAIRRMTAIRGRVRFDVEAEDRVGIASEERRGDKEDEVWSASTAPRWTVGSDVTQVLPRWSLLPMPVAHSQHGGLVCRGHTADSKPFPARPFSRPRQSFAFV